MAKSNGLSEKQLKADAAALAYEAAFIEQFNRYFAVHVPWKEIGGFSTDENAGKGSDHFMKALQAHQQLLPEERKFLAMQQKERSSKPATTIEGYRQQNPALAAFQELPEEDRQALAETYGKQPLPKDSPRRFLDDLPKAMQAFIGHDVRKLGLTDRLIEAAQQNRSGRIDDELYALTVKQHVDQLMKCERIKMDMLSPPYKARLLTAALMQLPELLSKREAILQGASLMVSAQGILKV